MRDLSTALHTTVSRVKMKMPSSARVILERMRQATVAMVTAAFIGCGSAPKKSVAPSPPASSDAGVSGPSVFDVDSSVPADLRVAIDHAQRLGRALLSFHSRAAS